MFWNTQPKGQTNKSQITPSPWTTPTRNHLTNTLLRHSTRTYCNNIGTRPTQSSITKDVSWDQHKRMKKKKIKKQVGPTGRLTALNTIRIVARAWMKSISNKMVKAKHRRLKDNIGELGRRWEWTESNRPRVEEIRTLMVKRHLILRLEELCWGNSETRILQVLWHNFNQDLEEGLSSIMTKKIF